MGKFRALLIVAAVGLSGCQGVVCPKLQGPGTANYQRQWVQRYDPYPEPGVGPTVDGSRPIDFELPRDETRRSRYYYLTPYERSMRQSRY